VQLDPALQHAYLSLAAQLRAAGFNTEVYLEPAKLDKQLRYADRAGIPVALLIGADEHAQNRVQVKNLAQQQQQPVALADLTPHLRAFFERETG
jgi:histidyl-tRNA synthetase